MGFVLNQREEEKLRNKSKKLAGSAVLALCLFTGISMANANGQEIYVPSVNYHMFDEVSNYPSVNTTPEDFKAQMSYFKKQGYSAITAGEYYAYLKGSYDLPEKPLLVTIDDGFLSVYKNAYPVLKELGMKATLYVITGEVEDGERLGLPMSSWEQLKEMNDSGVIEIGNHTHALHFRHEETAGKEALITNLSVDGQKITDNQRKDMIIEDIEKAEKLIKEKIGVITVSFSYPYGAYDRIAEEAVVETGHFMALTTQHGVNHDYTDPLLINRLNGDSNRSPQYYVKKFHEYAKSLTVYDKSGGSGN